MPPAVTGKELLTVPISRLFWKKENRPEVVEELLRRLREGRLREAEEKAKASATAPTEGETARPTATTEPRELPPR